MSLPAALVAHAADAARFETFVRRLSECFAGARAEHGGRAVTLPEYLSSDEPHRGDEQDIVDPIVWDILRALGYANEHIVYNRNEGLHGRPDFQVRLATAPDADLMAAPALVVESKSTRTRSFDKPQPGRDESAIDQLRRYVLSLGVYGRFGLLCNGRILEGWTFQDPDTLVVRVDLLRLAQLAGEGQLSDPRMLEALQVLWSRCSIDSFVDAGANLRRIAATVELSEAERRAIFETAAGRANPLKMEDLLAQAHETVWRAQALDVRPHRDHLVETLRRLIEEMTADVRHQLEDLLARVDGYQSELRREEAKVDLDAQLRGIRSFRRHFALNDAAFDLLCLQPLSAWRDSPRKGYINEQVEGMWQELKGSLVVEEDTRAEQIGLGLVPGPPEERRRAQKERRARVANQITDALREYCRSALTLALTRERVQAEHMGSVRALRAWQLWSQRMSSTVLVGAEAEQMREEFARQTAYVYIVRLLLVRICEDKGLFRRKFSDGGLAGWAEHARQYLDYAAGRSYEYLTRMAYECAQNVYVHFYGASEVFDWYRMDEKRLLRALAALNTFNLEHIDDDIIGAVYGRYLREGKHETGRYYTPRAVVRQMLDHAGWTTDRLIGGRPDEEGRPMS